MNMFGCNCTIRCTGAAVIAAAIIGVLTAFLQITGVILLTPAFLWVALGIAVVYLTVLAVTTALAAGKAPRCCLCRSLAATIVGILGTALFALVLLAVGITATSLASAILAGVLLFFLALVLTGTACLVKCLGECEDAA